MRETIDIKNILFRVFNIIFIITFGYIFILSIISPYEDKKAYNINSNILIFYLILMLIIFIGVRYQIDYINSNKILWILAISCFAIIIGLQLIFIKEFKVIAYYDLKSLYSEAVRLLHGNTMVEDIYYFGAYPYQFITTFIMYILFKIGSIFGMEDYKLILSIFNMFLLDIGIFIGFIYTLKQYNLKKAVVLIILIMLFPPIYTYIPDFYSDTISRIFPIIICVCYMLYLKNSNVKTRILYLIFIGVNIFIGYKIRATISIIGIAIAIHLVFAKKFKSLIAYIMIISIVGIAGRGVYKNIEENFLGSEYKEKAFPITHWLMMGLQGEGGYSQKDVDFTNSLETREDRLNEHINEIEKRIKQNGITGNIELINTKIRRVWGHGTYGYPLYLQRVEDYGRLYPYIVGEKNIIFLYYNHIYNSFLIMMIVVGSIGILVKNKYKGIGFLANIILFGWFLFYILWETQPRYTLTITPIILAIAFIGLEYLYEQISKGREIKTIILKKCDIDNKVIDFRKIKKVVKRGILIFVSIGTVIIGAYSYDRYVLEEGIQTDFIINQDKKRGRNIIEEVTSDKQVVQTFRTNKEFNRVELNFNTYNRKNTSSYKVELVDIRNKKLIYENVLNASDIKDGKFIKLSLDTIISNGTTEYAIIISSTDAEIGNALSLNTYYYKDYDMMPSGTLYINGKNMEADIQFKIYNEVSKELIRYDKYIAIILIIIIAQYSILKKILKSKQVI